METNLSRSAALPPWPRFSSRCPDSASASPKCRSCFGTTKAERQQDACEPYRRHDDQADDSTPFRVIAGEAASYRAARGRMTKGRAWWRRAPSALGKVERWSGLGVIVLRSPSPPTLQRRSDGTDILLERHVGAPRRPLSLPTKATRNEPVVDVALFAAEPGRPFD